MNHTNNGQQYWLQETNYKAEVKRVYPEAVCEEFIRLETLYRIKIASGYIGDWVYTIGSAWQSAYETLKQQNKL